LVVEEQELDGRREKEKQIMDYVRQNPDVPTMQLGRELKEKLHRGAEAIAGQIYILKKEGRY